jgi:ubiquinone/menaquinone biosynthesis C-methylase UbiE
MTVGDELGLEGMTACPTRIVDGIPCFDDSGYFFSEMNLERTLAMSHLGATVGWRNAALNVPSLFLRRYIADPNRTLFLSVVEIKEGDRILDVGAGWGNVSAQIARGFAGTEVYALDKTVERLQFANEIKKQEHIENLHLLQGDITTVPFEKNFFDLVLMIGILEWMGSSVSAVSPRAAQELALKTVHSLLRPGGKLLIGIENRFGLTYFLGHHDHTELAFTSLMPRRIANLYTKAKGKGPYLTYTYSRRGYEKLLKNAGFASVRFYGVLPDYRLPSVICDLDRVKEVSHRSIAKVLPPGFVGAFVNSFYIVARR